MSLASVVRVNILLPAWESSKHVVSIIVINLLIQAQIICKLCKCSQTLKTVAYMFKCIIFYSSLKILLMYANIQRCQIFTQATEKCLK